MASLVLAPATARAGGCAAITLAPASVPNGTMGVPYSRTITASGGAAPYTFAVVAGSLPPGLTLAPAGVLSGIPAGPGLSTFTVMATDASDCEGSRVYSILVNQPGCPVITLAPPSIPGGPVGTAYNQNVTASGGTAPYVFALAAGTLPPGITLTPGGLLSGTLGNAGVYRFAITATDFQGCIGAQGYDLVITDPVDPLTGEGLGAPNPNRVRVHDGSGAPTSIDFLAYGAGQWGVNVASGAIKGVLHAEILTGPGPGTAFGPQVRAFLNDGTVISSVNFYAYGTLRYGVNVGAADVDADHIAEILTGPGPGAVFGPHVRGWNYDGIWPLPMARIAFYAYATLRYGVNVGGGDVDGDLVEEILTGPGPGVMFGPQVRGFDYDNVAIDTMGGRVNFQAFATPQYGVNLALGDVDADGFEEIACSPGPGASASFPSRFVGFDYDDVAIAALPGYDVTPFATLYGGRVGLGDIDADDASDLLAAAGQDPSADSTVAPLGYASGTLTPLPAGFVAFPGSAYGVNIVGALLGF
ncbi:MAG: Ig domain-containing protein [Acidobacteriota bacterium]